jgi:predicted nucleotidyltransferase
MMPAFGRGSAVYLPTGTPYTTPMRPSQALAQHRDAVCNAAVRYRVNNMRVFGSVLHGRDAEGSDLDLLVDPLPGATLFDLGGLQDELEQLMGLRVDVLTPKDLPAKFRDQVLAEARAL